MTQNPPSARSPWATAQNEATGTGNGRGEGSGADGGAHAETDTHIGPDKAYWQARAGERLIAFLEAERHYALNLFFQAQYPAYPNKIYALAVLDERLELLEALITGAAELQEGGMTPEDLIAAATGARLSKTGMKPYKKQVSEIIQLEQVKVATDDRQHFDHAFALQFDTLVDAIEKMLGRKNAIDTDMEYIFERVHQGIEHMLENDTYPEAGPRGDIAKWPMAEALFKLAQNMQSLAQQAQACGLMIDYNAMASGDPMNPQSYVMSEFCDAVHVLASDLCTNLVAGLKDEIYMFDLTDTVEGFHALYGDEAIDPETEWQLDDNMMTQIKLQALLGRLMEEYAGDEELDAFPVLKVMLPHAAQIMMQCAENAFPVQDALKPPFIQAREEKAARAEDAETTAKPTQKPAAGRKAARGPKGP